MTDTVTPCSCPCHKEPGARVKICEQCGHMRYYNEPIPAGITKCGICGSTVNVIPRDDGTATYNPIVTPVVLEFLAATLAYETIKKELAPKFRGNDQAMPTPAEAERFLDADTRLSLAKTAWQQEIDATV